MARQPGNWYSMSYEEQQAWKKQEREVEDLEYDKRRVEEERDNDQRRHRRELESRRYELDSQREELARLQERIDELVGQVRLAERFIRQNNLWEAYHASDFSLETFTEGDDE